MLFQFLKVDNSFVRAMCHEFCSNVAILFKEPYTVRLWRCHSSVRCTNLHCMYTWQHKLCTDTNTEFDIVKATSFLPNSNALFYLTLF